jgi:LPXTG-site transpeptidase (sortase) family protein
LDEEKTKERPAVKPGEENLPRDWAVPDTNYSIYIPRIYAISRVSPNVDAGDPKVYLPALKTGVAEALGLSHPGQAGTTYLFAHSVGTRWDFARYNAVFYLLEKLEIGDRVEIVYDGKLYKYEIAEREILAASDTRYLVPQIISEKLVLATCYPPGTTWKRLVVVAKRI